MSKELNHILCIDDEADILRVAQLCLETMGGYQVTCCNNGNVGIEKAKELKPDIILIDVMMAGMGGPQTLKQLRTFPELDNIPVVFMTARIQPEEVEEYLKLGAAAVIAKPFEPMKISDEIKEIWDRVQK